MHSGGTPIARILYIGTSGPDDPTRAGFPFNFALGAIEAAHQPEIFLAGEATCVVKDAGRRCRQGGVRIASRILISLAPFNSIV